MATEISRPDDAQSLPLKPVPEPVTPPAVAPPAVAPPSVATAFRDMVDQLIHRYQLELVQYLARRHGLRSGSQAMRRILAGVPDRHTASFQNLALYCLRQQIDPNLLLEAVFFSWPGPSYPQPNQFVSPRALEAYRQYTQHLREQLGGYLRSQLQRLFAEACVLTKFLSPEASQRKQLSILMRNLAEHPLAVLIVAQRLGNRRSMDLALHPAALEYLRHCDIWDELLQGYLPDDFREYARDYVLPDLSRRVSPA